MIRRRAGVLAVVLVVGAGAVGMARADGTGLVPLDCARAAALAHAGEVAAAKKLYVDLASREGAPCAVFALSKLNAETAGDTLVSDVTRWLKLIGAGLAAFFAAALAVAVVYVVLSWTPARRLMARVVGLGRLFDPTLRVEPFTDAGADPAVGAGVTGLARTALVRLGEEQEGVQQLRVDNTAGVETIRGALGGLGELAPQAKGIVSLLTALPALARTPRYSIDGTLQLAGVEGDGLTVSLKERGDLADTTTLWWPSTQSANGAAAPDAYYRLASAAAAWADFRIRTRERLPRPPLTDDASSFGYFHAGVELDRAGRYDEAHDAYLEALIHDEDNVGALLNLGLLYAREENYETALALFERGVAIATSSRQVPAP
jgi:tetratricopeptide (TPR) repeat protein